MTKFRFKEDDMPNDIEATIDERSKTHGDYKLVAKTSQHLKFIMRSGGSQSYRAAESLDMIAAKLARIIHGDANDPDHWLDIEGYARLARMGLDE
jgi:hypothetical protein